MTICYNLILCKGKKQLYSQLKLKRARN